MGSVHEVQSASDSSPTVEDAWSVQLFICDTPLDFKIDTGADVSCITYTTYLNLCACPALEQSQSTLTGPSGDALAVKGQFVAHTTFQDEDYALPITVIDGEGSTNLFSR